MQSVVLKKIFKPLKFALTHFDVRAKKNNQELCFYKNRFNTFSSVSLLDLFSLFRIKTKIKTREIFLLCALCKRETFMWVFTAVVSAAE